MVIPLTWDEDGVTECAFVTRAFYRGKAVDQLQIHLKGGAGLSAGSSSPTAFSPEHSDGLLDMGSDGTCRIVTVCFDHEGNELTPAGVAPVFDTGCPFPTFGIVKSAVTNTRVNMSPHGQSVFADAVDAVQAVDLTFDALINEVDVSKMRVFLSDALFDREKSGDKVISIPFGKQDCTVFRKVMSTEDTIQEFAPALRTASQSEAFRIALKMLGGLCGFGLGYFDFDESRGYVRTATEVSADNSALMRNIRRHENALEGAITGIARAVVGVSRGFGRASLTRTPCVCSTTIPSSRTPLPRRNRTCARWGLPWLPGGIASSGMARRSRLHALERLRLARVPSNVKRLRAGLPEAVLPFVTRSPVRGGLGWQRVTGEAA